jgi:P-type Ca2+ transporter type 2C
VGQATDVALIEVLHKIQLTDIRDTYIRLAETPFSSDRKWMGVIAKPSSSHQEGEWFIKGAVEEILARCDTYISSRSTIILDEKIRGKILSETNKMSEEGLRVIAFANGRGEPDSSDRGGSGARGLTFTGLVGMFDPPRPGVSQAIRRLLNGGVRVMIITGDSPTTALSIARRLDIPIANPANSAILTGLDIDSLTDSELSDAISRVAIFARTTPRHKLKIIKALQQRGDVVAMTGDGVNDAPALKMADIGVSMGLGGTDVAKEAADMILSDDDFSTILSAIEEGPSAHDVCSDIVGKGIFLNIQNFLTFQLSTSVAALSLVALSTTLGLPNPLNAMQILWINILMDGPPAQSLGVEPVDPAVMLRPPRQRDALILTSKVMKRVLTQASVILIGTMCVYIIEMKDGKVTARDTTMVSPS